MLDIYGKKVKEVTTEIIINEIITEIIQKSGLITDMFEPKISTDITTYTITENKKLVPYLNITKKELINKIIEIGKNYELKGKDFTVIIKATNSTYMTNSTNIDFQKCEYILRNSSNIDISRILTLFQVEIDNINNQSLVNQIEYQIYDDNKTLLDLSECKDTDIEVYYSFKNDSYDLLS